MCVCVCVCVCYITKLYLTTTKLQQLSVQGGGGLEEGDEV